MHKIAMYPNSSASRYWRLQDPAKYLRRLGHEVVIFEEPVTKEMCEYFDIFITQGMVDKDGIALLYEYQQEHNKKIVIDQDDDIEVDPTNPHKKDHEVVGATDVIKKILEIADLVTTTTPYLKKKLSRYNTNVLEFPNYMDLERWDLKRHIHTSKEIRILWSGSITHMEDLKSILPVLTRIQAEFPQVKYIFMGEPRIRPLIKHLNHECMLGVPFEVYPTRLHTIAADIAIAPLKKTEFNECKSPIKFLEYSICQYPGIFSNTVYSSYVFDGNLGTVCYNHKEWYLALRNYLVCPQLRYDIAERAYNYVKSWYSLESRIKVLEREYRKLWTSSAKPVVSQPALASL